jgi:hypothetical protein
MDRRGQTIEASADDDGVETVHFSHSRVACYRQLHIFLRRFRKQ